MSCNFLQWSQCLGLCTWHWSRSQYHFPSITSRAGTGPSFTFLFRLQLAFAQCGNSQVRHLACLLPWSCWSKASAAFLVPHALQVSFPVCCEAASFGTELSEFSTATVLLSLQVVLTSCHGSLCKTCTAPYNYIPLLCARLCYAMLCATQCYVLCFYYER